MKTCKCTLRGKTVGDGCQVCNPDLVIEMLQDEVNEQATEIAHLQADNLKLRDAVDIDNLHWLIAYLYMQNEIGRAEKLRAITNALSSTPAQSLQDHDET